MKNNKSANNPNPIVEIRELKNKLAYLKRSLKFMVQINDNLYDISVNIFKNLIKSSNKNNKNFSIEVLEMCLEIMNHHSFYFLPLNKKNEIIDNYKLNVFVESSQKEKDQKRVFLNTG